MFTYVRLKNFKSLGEITFDFRKRKEVKSCKDVKQFIAVYGENGSGKSNFVESIAFIGSSIFNFSVRSNYDEMINALTEIDDPEVKSELKKQIERRITNPDKLFTKHRTFGCTEPTEVEYGILIDGKEWKYTLKFTDRLIEETLYGRNGKIRGEIYRLSYEADGSISKKFGSGLFKNKKIKEEYDDEIEKYWGRNSFMSLYVYQKSKQNKEYIEAGIDSALEEFVGSVLQMRVGTRRSDGNHISGMRFKNILHNFGQGTIDRSETEILQKSESLIKSFFTQAYSDIKNVYYITEPAEDNQIKYTLCFDKMLAGEIRSIPIVWESYGTRNLLNKINYLLAAFMGATAVCDEFDSGIHDLLVDSILVSAKETLKRLIQEDENFQGQLIITTHNTLLLESIASSDAYVIDIDYLGNKEAICLSEYPIQKTDNKRLKYLKGLFGGVPMTDGIDFSSIMDYGDGNEEEA